jgi:hypothetical protein
MSLYLLPFITVILHTLLWIMANTRLITFVPKTVGKVIAEVDFWFRSGRTVLSIPLSLLMLLPFYLQILSIKYDFIAIEHFGSNRATLRWFVLHTFENDPLADQLYII